jgi:imidazoleglycerol-phosphate dehydratase
MSSGAKRESASKSGRRASVSRTTRETDITVDLNVDGSGEARSDTGIRFLDHMIETFARHGLFDLSVKARGDLEVDQHHTVEDVGLVLGQAFREALGDKAGICRFGDATCPLDEALITAVVDIGGRPFLVYEVEMRQARVGTFDAELVHDFLLALSNQLGLNLHVTMVRGRNTHHIVEATFKSLARAMDQATRTDPRVQGIPSTKGSL